MKKEKKQIVVLADGFMNWPGGVDFFATNVQALLATYNPSEYALSLLFPEKKFFRRFSRLLLKLPICNRWLTCRAIEKSEWLKAFQRKEKDIPVHFSPFGKRRLNRFLLQQKADVAFFCWSDLPVGCNDIGYYPDLQYKYFPEFFSEKECRNRDRTLSNLLSHRQAIVVNSQDVKRDLEQFFPETTCEIYALPFAPILLDQEWLDPLPYDVKEKYRISHPYFMISNQFWKHKSHLTAFDAMRELICASKEIDVHLVCTGKSDDPRFPHYYSQLLAYIDQLGIKERVHLLGHIPKREQIELMKGSLGILQPTLFEGGPGGGAVYNAVALGVPAIVSDIAVNREISEEGVSFFRVGESRDFALKMQELLKTPPPRPSREALLEKRERNIQKLGEALLEPIKNAS